MKLVLSVYENSGPQAAIFAGEWGRKPLQRLDLPRDLRKHCLAHSESTHGALPCRPVCCGAVSSVGRCSVFCASWVGCPPLWILRHSTILSTPLPLPHTLQGRELLLRCIEETVGTHEATKRTSSTKEAQRGGHRANGRAAPSWPASQPEQSRAVASCILLPSEWTGGQQDEERGSEGHD